MINNLSNYYNYYFLSQLTLLRNSQVVFDSKRFAFCSSTRFIYFFSSTQGRNNFNIRMGIADASVGRDLYIEE